MIKRFFLFLMFSLVGCAFLFAQKDMIMLRDGKKMNVIIVQVNNEFVLYKLSDKKKAMTERVDSRSVYMIHYEKRGNLYFTSDGERFSGEKQKIDEDADVIYLVEGGELMAYKLTIESDCIRYKASDKRKGPFTTLPKEKVFLIQYKDGAVDIITAFPKSKMQNIHSTINVNTNIDVNPIRDNNVVIPESSNDTYGSPNSNVETSASDSNENNLTEEINFDPQNFPDVPFQAVIHTTDGWTIKALVKEVGNGHLMYTKISSPTKAAKSLSYDKIKKVTIL